MGGGRSHLLGGNVEVVGRLVEEEQIRRREEHAAQGDARLLAARQRGQLVIHLVLLEHETAEERAQLLVHPVSLGGCRKRTHTHTRE